MEKPEFLKALTEFSGRSSQLSQSEDRSQLSICEAEARSLLVKTKKILELVRVFRKTEAHKVEHKEIRGETKKKIKRIVMLKKELTKLRSPDPTLSLINKKNSTIFTSEEVLLYACKISNFCQSVPNYRTTDSLFPWSFGPNKVELPEMECSSLYYMYKNNPHYRRLNPPKVIYLKESKNNIQDTRELQPNEYQIVARENLQMLIQKEPEELYVYTTDGREPNKYLVKEPLPEVISVFKDTVVKIKAYRPGFIDSPAAIFHIRLEEPGKGQDDDHGLDGMVRPDEIKDELSESFNGYEDLFGGEEGFVSYRDPDTFSTPGN